MKNKSIIINEKAHKELKILSEGFNTNYGSFVEKMILYFKKTGNDPSDQKNYSASQKLQTLDKRIVSFLKVQERDILKPLRQETFDYYKKLEGQTISNQTKMVEAFNQLNSYNQKRNQLVVKKLDQQQKAIISIAEFLDKKNKASLITKVQNLFN